MAVGSRNSSHFAYDVSKNILSKGDIWDEDAINQSIELIIATMYGERVFNQNFGSPVGGMLFQNFRGVTGSILDAIVDSINTFEPRVSVVTSLSSAVSNPDSNEITINLTYIIIQNNVVGNFNKVISN